MAQKRRTYTKEFKTGVCDSVISGEMSVADTAEKHGISPIMLYRWIDEYRNYKGEAFIGKGHKRANVSELKTLRRENEELKKEIEVLKKTVEYYNKHYGTEKK